MSVEAVIESLAQGNWDEFRGLVRLHRARWIRLEPSLNELHAALDKAASEIIALRQHARECHDIIESLEDKLRRNR